MKGLWKSASVVVATMLATVSAYAQHGAWGTEMYVGLGAGVVSVKDVPAAPTFSMRFGIDAGRYFAEADISYVSVNMYDWEYDENIRLSTMTAGADIGVKFLYGERGHVAAVLYGGYALQEDGPHRGGPHHGPRPGYHGKGYFGVGLQGQLDLSRNVSLFAEARYQSLPVYSSSRWGVLAQGGLKFYF